mmetsp:Transcript_41517/g.93625  ORF Transcript_41517/g.93625 Transcript_41517/m.93625 type:complete len:355 (-) Transcript_41517:229-1293(-)
MPTRKVPVVEEPLPSVSESAVFHDSRMVMSVVAGLVVLCLVLLVSASRRKRYNLKGKHVVVTGGSSGIGKSIARLALERGARSVTILARKASTLEAARTELASSVKSGQSVFAHSVDVGSSPDKVKAAMEAACSESGPVDVLVNCAGTSVPGRFEDLDASVFEQMMRVNYLGSVYPTRAVVPAMKARGSGRVVFVSSQAGQVGVFGFAAYSPSKFALVGLAQVLRMELKPYGVGVSIAFPPDTDTPGFALENTCKPEETRLISETAGLFKPDEVARGIVGGLERGDFSIWVGLDGWMLATLTAGMAPASSILEGLTQGLLTSVLRVIGLCYVESFDGIARAGKKKREAQGTQRT